MKQKKEANKELNLIEFQKHFKDDYKEISNSFLKRHIVNLKTFNFEEYNDLINLFKELIESICTKDYGDVIKACNNLVRYNIEYSVPYIILSQEMISFKRVFLERFIMQNRKELVFLLYKINMILEDLIAKEYLIEYQKNLLERNILRQNSLNDIFEQTVITYYKSHLEWLSNLAIIVISKEDNFPETNHTLCLFGKWLDEEGRNIIQNPNRYQNIVKIHKELHDISKQIKRLINTSDSNHIILTLLEKCEMNSLSLGAELALVDNTLMNQKISKDSLTGALTRQKLKALYLSQLEISFATSEPFVMAMCDLDFFKQINDQYGHIAGDRILFEFVNLVKKELRTSDMIFRYGGEEFVIILPSIRYKKAYDVLDNVRDKFSKLKIMIDDKEIGTTVSMGILEINLDINGSVFFKDMDKIISIIDKKLYEAKTSGRNRIC